MKICVLNGSPKGDYSVTLQTVLFLQKKYPICEFEILHVGQRIKAYEKDMSQAIAAISQCDLLLFCYPVYTFIAPYQLHRFVELLKESDISLENKYAAQLTTSKHFYDVTAHHYIRENSMDLHMKYVGGLSQDMDDLLSEKGQQEALAFWDYTMYCTENDLYETPMQKRQILPKMEDADHSQAVTDYMRKDADKALDKTSKVERQPLSESTIFDTVILTNCAPKDEELLAMIAHFQAEFPYETRVINVAEFPFDGGCLGCLKCASDGKCVYKDGFDTFLREEIQKADAMVYAFTIRDHSMGASCKRYDDRQFCNGHRTVTMGMPMGYIIHGDYANETNLQMIVRGRCDVGNNFLAGEATNREEINRLSRKLSYALEHQLVLPQMFLGVGGTKIFRDLIYMMRGFMRADHKFYKEHGIYDFPQKKVGTILGMKLVGSMFANPKIRAKMGNKMNEGMLAPYKKVLNACDRTQ